MWKKGAEKMKNEVLNVVEKEEEMQHPYAFHVSGPRNVSSPNWKDLINSSWLVPKSSFSRSLIRAHFTISLILFVCVFVFLNEKLTCALIGYAECLLLYLKRLDFGLFFNSRVNRMLACVSFL